MPRDCLLSFLLSIAGCGPIWLRQQLPWLRSVSRFGTEAPSSMLLSRFAVNKEEAVSLISGGTIPELHPFSPSLSRFYCEGIRRNDSVSRPRDIAQLFQTERMLIAENCVFENRTFLFWRKFIIIVI